MNPGATTSARGVNPPAPCDLSGAPISLTMAPRMPTSAGAPGRPVPSISVPPEMTTSFNGPHPPVAAGGHHRPGAVNMRAWCRMRVADVRTHVLAIPHRGRYHWAIGVPEGTNNVLVEVHTDEESWATAMPAGLAQRPQRQRSSTT